VWYPCKDAIGPSTRSWAHGLGPGPAARRKLRHPSTITLISTYSGRTMKDLGLLWIPAGFLVIFGSVAALFLTI
jgi:hypothetical protein